MKLYGRARKRARYRHWETWAALGAFVACVVLGEYIGGSYLGHPLVFLIIGAVVGSVITTRTARHVDRQYNQ